MSKLYHKVHNYILDLKLRHMTTIAERMAVILCDSNTLAIACHSHPTHMPN